MYLAKNIKVILTGLTDSLSLILPELKTAND